MKVYRPVGKGAVEVGAGTYAWWAFMKALFWIAAAMALAVLVAAVALLVILWGALAGTFDWQRAGRSSPWSQFARRRARLAGQLAERVGGWFGAR